MIGKPDQSDSQTLGANSWTEVELIIRRLRPSLLTVGVYDSVVYRDLVGVSAVERVIQDLVESAELGGSGGKCASSIGQKCELSIANSAPGAVDVLQRIRESGIEIRFVSDTLMPSAAIREILVALSLAQPSELVLVSCEHVDITSEAELHVLASESHTSEVSVHVGPTSLANLDDEELAEGTFVRYGALTPNRYEKRFAATGVAGSILAGAARKARCNESAETSTDQALIELGASLLGISMTSFALWVNQISGASGRSNLAFCARDGELPMRCFNALPEGYSKAEQVTYLHVNRIASSIAGIRSIGIDKWIEIGTLDPHAFLRYGLHSRPIGEFVRCLALSFEELPSDTSLADEDPSLPLGEELAHMWEEVLSHPDVRFHLENISNEQFGLVSDYMRQSGICSDSWILVDIGWRGQLAAIVSSIVSLTTGKEPLSIHFGARGRRKEVDALYEIDHFAFNEADRTTPFSHAIPCIESLVGSGKERASRFEREPTGQVRAIFTDPVPEIATQDREVLWQSAIRVASELPQVGSPLFPYLSSVDELRNPSGLVFADFWQSPTLAEATAVGRFKLDIDTGDGEFVDVASPYTLAGILRPKNGVSRQWKEGSLALTAPLLRASLQFSERLRNWISKRVKAR